MKTLVTLQPTTTLPPSSKSATKLFTTDLLLSLKSMVQDEYTLYVVHSFFNVFRVARGPLSATLYSTKERKSTSPGRVLPEHSTSCRLAILRKSLTLIPERDDFSTEKAKPNVEALCAQEDLMRHVYTNTV